LLPLAQDASSLQARFARSFDRLLSEGSPRRFPADGAIAMMFPATSTPCWAKATSGEFLGTFH
jgi:hypothetical protein